MEENQNIIALTSMWLTAGVGLFTAIAALVTNIVSKIIERNNSKNQYLIEFSSFQRMEWAKELREVLNEIYEQSMTLGSLIIEYNNFKAVKGNDLMKEIGKSVTRIKSRHSFLRTMININEEEEKELDENITKLIDCFYIGSNVSGIEVQERSDEMFVSARAVLKKNWDKARHGE